MSIIVSEVYEAFIDAGATEEKAKAAAAVIPVGEQLATKNDIAEVKAEVSEFKAEMDTRLTRLGASLESRFATARAESANEFKTLYRNLWLMAASIVTVNVALDKFLP